ncbi:FecCD family ABC transporter permease [Phyllobacterium endophyticum]|uniref:Iron ABC transporter permease n=1 Tax=Phyllobacterium endophyticum TaxID=1149773 RepID=A0A2P7B1Y0_9HYPH|nr:iron ABC transporter permease [Phyllobacterium endophyticum]MBB3238044.1 iron complex transport system permease protein [Phyllobacterium endophyticum]PSH60458.1 iron ABC transporter permease [Phyllobacterium endophyticum]TYR42635.1 iron ABC transporter permease [Phyllobacterium endophyticum]
MSRERAHPMARNSSKPVLIGCLLAIGLAAIMITSVSVGVSKLPIHRALALLASPDGTPDSALIWNVRMPRIVLALLVGANLAMAGVLIQTLTRNPLASPQTFGINAGASLAIVLCLIALPQMGGASTVWPAFAGAAAVGLAMWALSVSGTITDMKLALAGISIQLVLAALVQAILIANNAAQDILYWLAGSINGAQWGEVRIILPFTVMGGGAALLAGRHFGVLELDETTGLSLGQNAKRVGGLAAFLIVVLAGSAVAVSGPIGFIGLLVPHFVRRLAGGDQLTLIVLSAIAGPLLLNSADLLGRIAAFPAEMPVGIVTALLGAPAFLLILWRQRAK